MKMAKCFHAFKASWRSHTSHSHLSKQNQLNLVAGRSVGDILTKDSRLRSENASLASDIAKLAS